MEYTLQIFPDFIKDLAVFDQECRKVMEEAANTEKQREKEETAEWKKITSQGKQNAEDYGGRIKNFLAQSRERMQEVLSDNLKGKSGILDRIEKCQEALALIYSAEGSVAEKELYESQKNKKPQPVSMTIEDILNGKIDFADMAERLNEALRGSKKKELSGACGTLYNASRSAETLIQKELASLRSQLVHDREDLHRQYQTFADEWMQSTAADWEALQEQVPEIAGQYTAQKSIGPEKTRQAKLENAEWKKKKLNELAGTFFQKYPPEAFAQEYSRLYAQEPSFEAYECYKTMPKNVHIGTLEYDSEALGLCDDTKQFLNQHYYFLYQEPSLRIPHCVSFDPEFHYLFQYDEEGKNQAVKSACDLGMRLFMMLPPGKVNFTFIDPVSLGSSFAMFTQLVSADDRTSEVINGKIWSAPADIEQKLKVMTDHISNVTQRCLQGKYENIYEYNCAAEQNAEAYQILMLMDFPAGLTDQSLKMLEQIIASGPRCGVFTVMYRNESQFKKVSERSHPFIENIEVGCQKFQFREDGTWTACQDETINDTPLIWSNFRMPDAVQMEKIIETLKKGIKNADKIVIDIDKVSEAESSSSTRDGIRIPIGIHGAKDVQYLTLGTGGSHHALIAGVAGSGKSSLLHTIILKALSQYSPDELLIYLVDFKRGVEFKIYADYVLPAFKVIAIESEREFGYNILLALEREQKIRADLFKKNHVDKIEEYRASDKKMPRILVIMDEFHELFSNGNDEIAKKSAAIMERIVRQGRAFGVHMILASQSYSNITGIDRSVFDQMAVRIVLKCSKADANLLLDHGSSEIDQISIDDPGRAVYNSEAGNQEYNSHFRVAYIPPEKHGEMLKKISEETLGYAGKPTRILLSNIEDNKYSIFNQFENYKPDDCLVPGCLYVGEPLGIDGNMNMDLVRKENANLLMVGNDTEKARNMFAFAMLSLCINYKVRYGKAPEKPFIYFLNCKPLEDTYFEDIPKMIAEKLLPEYVHYIHCGEEAETQNVLSNLYDQLQKKGLPGDKEQYFFVFGYQRAEELKSEIKLSQGEDIDSLFNLMSESTGKPQLSPKEIFHLLVKDGAKCGIHTILWQDSYHALEQDDNNMISYFNLRTAFDMPQEEFSRFVGENDASLMSESNAIYYNRARDNQRFRPYQTPDEEWLNGLCKKLHG